MDNNQLALLEISAFIIKEMRQMEGETYLLKLKSDEGLDMKSLTLSPYEIQEYYNKLHTRIKYLEGKFESYQKIIEIIKNKDEVK
jgi:hypothetical protein